MTLRRLLPVLLLPSVMLWGEVREQILVVVNNHIVTQRVYQQAVEQGTAALYREFSGQELDAKLRVAREKILQGLIDTDLIEDKAADLGVKITDETLRGVVDEVKRQNNFSSDADFERALKGSLGIGLPAYLQRARQDLVKQEVLRREVFSRIAVEDQEVRAYYEDHKDEYRQPSRFRVRELVLPKGATPQEQEESRAKLAQVQDGVRKGTSFEELVKTFSTAPSRGTGGDLGWLSKGVLRPDLEAAVLSLRVGQVSAPLETENGVYLLQLTDSEMNNVRPFAEVRASILQKLQEPKAENAIESYIQNLRIRANIHYVVPKESILKG